MSHSYNIQYTHHAINYPQPQARLWRTAQLIHTAESFYNHEIMIAFWQNFTANWNTNFLYWLFPDVQNENNFSFIFPITAPAQQVLITSQSDNKINSQGLFSSILTAMAFHFTAQFFLAPCLARSWDLLGSYYWAWKPILNHLFYIC